jgi:hypothetical protein
MKVDCEDGAENRNIAVLRFLTTYHRKARIERFRKLKLGHHT